MTRLGLQDPKLQEIIDLQPGAATKRGAAQWVQKNWLAIVMALSWAAGQFVSGDRWVQARSAQQDALSADLASLRRDVQASEQTYVRHDVFDQVLKRIDDHLASIDQKINQLH